jgi:hypothetical protein
MLLWLFTGGWHNGCEKLNELGGFEDAAADMTLPLDSSNLSLSSMIGDAGEQFPYISSSS